MKPMLEPKQQRGTVSGELPTFLSTVVASVTYCRYDRPATFQYDMAKEEQRGEAGSRQVTDANASGAYQWQCWRMN